MSRAGIIARYSIIQAPELVILKNYGTLVQYPDYSEKFFGVDFGVGQK